jgi:hypothetical protein
MAGTIDIVESREQWINDRFYFLFQKIYKVLVASYYINRRFGDVHGSAIVVTALDYY